MERHKLTLRGCVVSNVVSLDVVCDELNDCVWCCLMCIVPPLYSVVFSTCTAWVCLE